MKKLMFMAAAIAAGVAVADVTSANVVGYANIDRPAAYRISCAGSMFVTPGQTKYSLADLALVNVGTSKMNARKNYIQFFMSGDTPRLDASRKYYFIEGTGNPHGWMQMGGTAGSDTPIADPSAIEFDACEGFYCDFNSATAKITYSGEVITGIEKKVTFTRPSDRRIFVVANPSAGEINLSQISFANVGTSKMNARKNYIQFFMSGDTPRLDASRKYYFIEGTGNPHGWMQMGATAGSDSPIADPSTIKINPGEGFYCDFNSASATITLPTSL